MSTTVSGEDLRPRFNEESTDWDARRIDSSEEFPGRVLVSGFDVWGLQIFADGTGPETISHSLRLLTRKTLDLSPQKPDHDITNLLADISRGGPQRNPADY